MRATKAATASFAVITAISFGAATFNASADDDSNKQYNVWSSFGRGLNTAQPGNAANHVIFPKEIKVKTGGVVNFAVAGFHDIVIFKPGFNLEDLKDVGGGQFPVTPPIFVIPADPAAPLPVPLAALNDKIYYRGINPAGGPLGTAAVGNPANGSNRMEPIAFLEKGTYLVICNIRGHLLDGMYGYVKVVGDD